MILKPYKINHNLTRIINDKKVEKNPDEKQNSETNY
jgi:hypothetical protein